MVRVTGVTGEDQRVASHWMNQMVRVTGVTRKDWQVATSQ